MLHVHSATTEIHLKSMPRNASHFLVKILVVYCVNTKINKAITDGRLCPQHATHSVYLLIFIVVQNLYMHMIAHSDNNLSCKYVVYVVSCHLWSSDRCASFIKRMLVNCEQLQVHLQLVYFMCIYRYL